MSRFRDRLPENGDGDFYVDLSCIDCDLCRRLAPAVFTRSDAKGQSYSWPEQQRSMVRLADHPFMWILPGHGRRYHAGSPEAMRGELLRLAAAM
ncbi:MAG: ferredoxin [Kofleriaceae bacterium]